MSTPTIELVGRGEVGYGQTPGSTRRALSRIRGVVIHHNPNQPRDKSLARWARDVDHYHRHSNGWSGGIGYHAGARDGIAVEGRPIESVGAHSPPVNDTHLGLTLATNGAHVHRDDLAALGWMVARWEDQLGRRLPLSGHRDHQATGCPSDRLHAQLGAVRRWADHYREHTDERTDEMYLYVDSREGSPDSLAALWAALARPDLIDGVTAAKTRAVELIEAGEDVRAVGGPAADQLGQGGAIRGRTAQETMQVLTGALDTEAEERQE